MRNISCYINPAAVAALIALATLPGCFTGIERTPTIKDSSSSKSTVTKSPEQELLAGVGHQPVSQWRAGKPFIITEGRLQYAYSPSAEATALSKGDTIRLSEVRGQVRLSGDSVTDIAFTTPRGTEVYTRIESPLSTVLSGDNIPLPFAIDADMVDEVRRELSGRKVWTLRTGKMGRKYEAVTITDVVPGNADFPLRVVAGPDTLFMVVNSRGASARTFDNLFSLSDPRKRYPGISDEHWNLICMGKIAVDMTREECRLALGAPAEVDRTAAYNGLIERWTYENGVYLYFTDGVLTRFRL